jgi:hypothetical protein
MTKLEKVKYLIIGNSAGGIGAAEAIREVDKTWVPMGGEPIVGRLGTPLQLQPLALARGVTR